jgi:hypothetical protein
MLWILAALNVQTTAFTEGHWYQLYSIIRRSVILNLPRYALTNRPLCFAIAVHAHVLEKLSFNNTHFLQLEYKLIFLIIMYGIITLSH